MTVSITHPTAADATFSGAGAAAWAEAHAISLTGPALIGKETSGAGTAVEVSLPLSVANGGTGAATLTSNRSLWGNGTSAISDDSGFTRTGAAGRYLFGATDNGTDKVQVNGGISAENMIMRYFGGSNSYFAFLASGDSGTLSLANGVAFFAANASGGSAKSGGTTNFSGGSGDGAGGGGSFQATAGSGGSSGPGGNITFVAGAAGKSGGDGGTMTFLGGNVFSGHGGGFALTASNGSGTNKNGGGFTLNLGAATGSGTYGQSIIASSTGDSRNNSVPEHLRLRHTTSGTPAVGIGVGMVFEAETSNNNNELGAAIHAVTTTVTAGSEDFDLVFRLMAAGAAHAEKFRILSTGTIQFGTHTALGAEALSGYITVKDSGGTDRKLAVIS